MECELKLWLNYSPKGGEPEPTPADLPRLSSALRELLPRGRVRQGQDGDIEIPGCSPAEIASVKEIASGLHIPISCRLVEHFSRRELRQVKFAPLTLEGDNVDDDADGNPLNRFPSLLCPSCRMPDEGRLPSPFYVSAKQMRRRGQDGVPGERLQRDREAFWCGCGVVVVSDRLRRILDVLEQPFSSAPIVGTPRKEVAPGFQALRPAHSWGRRQNAISSVPCSECGQARRCHINIDIGSEALYANRIVVNEDRFPDFDLVCSETWLGDRTGRPSESADFIRDIYLSGRLYDLLLEAKVPGLMPPQQVVAFRETIPMVEPVHATTWVRTKLELLQNEGLL